MAVKTILTYPEFSHILKHKSEPVQMADPDNKQVIQDMKDTLIYTEHGVGLAAPQIGVLKRIFVLRKDMINKDLARDSHIAKTKDEVAVFINPKIVAHKGKVKFGEGCLSVPGYSADIERAKVVKIRAFDENGNIFYERLQGLAAIAVQQEMDHLDGVLILDYEKK